ncbi:LOW QUALITY PROTEIN: probable metabolite transport protein CsbC [Musca autumnalis]|uniref:LOW QUALITY PROTEIN: probable metabolite transport protein CsbC n=1 Tax=Musca autumnalis TaxID=221902 RepID=UPI003CE86E78
MAQSATTTTIVCEIGASTKPSPSPMPTWYSRHHLASMAGGAVMFTSGGMAMAHGLGWTQFRVTGFNQHFHCSWFVAVIIGTMISVQLGKYMPKKFIAGISSLLILAGGTIFIADHNTMDSLVAGRYLNGIAVGLLTPQFLSHIADISRVNQRGACLGLEQFSVTLGVALQMIISKQWEEKSHFAANRLHGILDVILAILAAISLCYFVESPLDYLRMGDEASALSSLARLQRPPRVNKTHLSEQENLSATSWLGPLAKMLVFRSMMLALTFSMPLSEVLNGSSAANVVVWPIITAAGLRLVGSFLSLIVVDKIGRKFPSILTAGTVGALMLAISILCLKHGGLNNSNIKSYLSVLCMAIQFCAGLFAPITSAYMGEAFPIKAKTYCLGVCVILEQAIQIAVILANIGFGIKVLLLVESVMILVAFVFFCITMPETSHKTPREAQKMFRYFFNWKFV